jgi:hypothetical protein
MTTNYWIFSEPDCVNLNSSGGALNGLLFISLGNHLSLVPLQPHLPPTPEPSRFIREI